LLLRQAKLTHAEHLLLETLLAALDEVGVVKQKQVLQAWRVACEREEVGDEAEGRDERRLASVLESLDAEQRYICEPLLREGFLQVEAGKRRDGLRLLERAAAQAIESAPLNLLIGVEHFRARKMTLARAYLERAARADAEDAGAALLLGLALVDVGGETDEAVRLLRRAVKSLKKSFAGSYALGRLRASEGRWGQALVEFKRALSARPCPEANFVVGLACHVLGREELAWRYVSKALGEDTRYPVALFLAGVIQTRLGEPRKARELFSLARALGLDAPPVTRSAKSRAGQASDEFIVSSFLGAGREIRKGLLLVGDERLAALLIEDALESVKVDSFSQS
ncbi:MAG: tetratricopeptide repeat protein, partial [Pyrinomonadaceae bacterium]